MWRSPERPMRGHSGAAAVALLPDGGAQERITDGIRQPARRADGVGVQRLTRLPADALPADAPAPGGRRKTKRPNLRRGVIEEPDIRYQAGVAYQASIAARSFFMAFFSS